MREHRDGIAEEVLAVSFVEAAGLGDTHRHGNDQVNVGFWLVKAE